MSPTPPTLTLLHGEPLPPNADIPALARQMCARLRVEWVITWDKARHDFALEQMHLENYLDADGISVFRCRVRAGTGLEPAGDAQR